MSNKKHEVWIDGKKCMIDKPLYKTDRTDYERLKQMSVRDRLRHALTLDNCVAHNWTGDGFNIEGDIKSMLDEIERLEKLEEENSYLLDRLNGLPTPDEFRLLLKDYEILKANLKRAIEIAEDVISLTGSKLDCIEEMRNELRETAERIKVERAVAAMKGTPQNIMERIPVIHDEVFLDYLKGLGREEEWEKEGKDDRP